MSTPFPYKSKLERSSFDEVKITQEFDDDTRVTQKILVFSGQHGLEGLEYCREKFEKAAKREMQWTTDYELMANAYKMFDGQALDQWENEAQADIDPDNIQNGDYAKACAVMRTIHGGAEARDTILNYLKTVKCMKPRETRIEVHIHRIREMIRIANNCEGIRSKVTPLEEKEYIFDTLPQTMKDNFISAGKDLASSTVQQMTTYFSRQKTLMDRTAIGKRNYGKSSKSSPNKASSSSSYKANSYKGSKGSKANKSTKGEQNDKDSTKRPRLSPDDTCPIHGGHKWGKCFDNKFGENYKPGKSSKGRSTYTAGSNSSTAGRGSGATVHYVQTRDSTSTQGEEVSSIRHTTTGNNEANVVENDPLVSSWDNYWKDFRGRRGSN